METLVDAYWRYFGLSSGDRADRLAAEDLFWAWERVTELAEGETAEAISTLVALAQAAPGTPGVDLMDDDRLLTSLAYLGAGPVEDFINAHGEEAVQPIDTAARRNERIRIALRCTSFDRSLSPASAERLRRFGEPL